MRKYLGNTPILIVSRIIQCLCTRATSAEDAESASWKQKLVFFFPVCSPKQHGHKMFLHNVFSFALAFIVKTLEQNVVTFL